MNCTKWMTAAAVIGACGLSARAQEPPRAPAGGEQPAAEQRVVEQPVVVERAVEQPVVVERIERNARRLAEEAGRLRAEARSHVAGADKLRGLILRAKQPGQAVKATYLGISSSPAQPALQKQLQLKPGVGLVVDGVQEGSPAAQAGVKEFDILHKLDEQLLVNCEQFAVLVRTYAPGAEVKLTVIREGKPQVLTAKLTERESEPLQLMFDADRGEMHLDFAAQPVLADPVKLYGGAIHIKSPDGKRELRAARVSIENDRHSMTLGPKDGRKHLSVTDKEGKVVFEGPLDTPADLEKVPADLRHALPEVLLDDVMLSEKERKPTSQPADRPGVPAPRQP